MLGPQRDDYHQDHRLLAKLIPTEFRAHLVLGYEILKWESDLPNPSLYVPVPNDIAHEKARHLTRRIHRRPTGTGSTKRRSSV